MNPKVDTYIETKSNWSEELQTLRSIFLSTEMEEDFKWGGPVYTVNGKNVTGMAAFKNHYGMWFFNGVFLKDNHSLLVNTQETTKALRQIKFKKGEEIPTDIIRDYVLEAIENEKQGLKVAPSKPGAYSLSPYLKEAMDNDSELLNAFIALTPGKQKDYSNHISDAKQEKTKASRLEKIRPMILAGGGLHDKYKNC
jgi:uncharacterized protein YdeI (YjbR/CyaY-like superfamily)